MQNQGAKNMKRQSFVLFIIICLVGCQHQQSAPIDIENIMENEASVEPTWPSSEYNRAAIVLVEFYVEGLSGKLEQYSYRGLVVGPHSIISKAPYEQTPVLTRAITVRPILTGSFGVPASVVLRMDRGLRNSEVVLLTIDDDLPHTSPAVFGGRIPAKGYLFWDGFIMRDQAKQHIIPVLTTLSGNTQDCDAVEQFPPQFNISDIIFDTKHRLLCYNEIPSQEVESFLRENGVPIVTK